jgi:ketosteroid isomerase-like protein
VVIEGHEGLRRAGAEWTETFESFRFDIEEVEVPDGRVVVIGCWRGTAKGSGVEVELPEAHVWTLCDGKLAESQAYVSRAEAYRAVGHSADEA